MIKWQCCFVVVHLQIQKNRYYDFISSAFLRLRLSFNRVQAQHCSTLLSTQRYEFKKTNPNSEPTFKANKD